MKEFVEKLIERLEEASHYEGSTFDEDGYCNDDSWEVVYLDKAIEIVNQLAEEYVPETNVGKWIPCSERLPKESLNSVIGWDEHRQRCCFVQYIGGRFVLGNDIESVKIIAWQPLPEPYKPEQKKEIPTNYYTERFNR